jgi:hypothetical protein
MIHTSMRLLRNLLVHLLTYALMLYMKSSRSGLTRFPCHLEWLFDDHVIHGPN